MTTLATFRALNLCTEASWYFLASSKLRGHSVKSTGGGELSLWMAMNVMQGFAREGSERIRDMARRNLEGLGTGRTREIAK